jgi:hypothetical protein
MILAGYSYLKATMGSTRVERIRQIPGVQAADFTETVPLSGQVPGSQRQLRRLNPPVKTPLTMANAVKRSIGNRCDDIDSETISRIVWTL